MAHNDPIDFSILMKDFTKAAQKTHQEVNRLLQKSPHATTAEQEQLTEALKEWVSVTKNIDRQTEAMHVLFTAADEGDTITLQQALSQGVDVNYMNKGGFTLLAFAAASGQENAVDFLIGKQADVNLKGSNQTSYSPIEFAAMKDRVKIFNKLVKAGATIDKKRLNSIAEMNESTKVLKALQKIKR